MAKYCMNCGNPMEDGHKFCLNCGAPAVPAPAQAPAAPAAPVVEAAEQAAEQVAPVVEAAAEAAPPEAPKACAVVIAELKDPNALEELVNGKAAEGYRLVAAVPNGVSNKATLFFELK